MNNLLLPSLAWVMDVGFSTDAIFFPSATAGQDSSAAGEMEGAKKSIRADATKGCQRIRTP
jgi:hypothetical protein